MEEKREDIPENSKLHELQPELMEKLTKDNYLLLLREEIDFHLKVNKISPEDFAKRCGVTGRTIYGIIKGETGDVMAGNMLAIFEALYVGAYVSRPSRK